MKKKMVLNQTFLRLLDLANCQTLSYIIYPDPLHCYGKIDRLDIFDGSRTGITRPKNSMSYPMGQGGIHYRILRKFLMLLKQ